MSNNPSSNITDVEQYELDAIDDSLQRIVDFKHELEAVIAHERKWHPEINLTEMIALMEEAFDEAHHAEWHRLTRKSRSIGWPTEIPSFGALAFKTPKHRADQEYMMRQNELQSNKSFRPTYAGPTNPQTLIATGKLEA